MTDNFIVNKLDTQRSKVVKFTKHQYPNYS